MSVQPGPTFKRYAANGVATVYGIPFLLLDAADLQITLNGVLVTTGFTLSGIGNPASACTFTSPPTGDLLFQQVMVFQRLSDYQMNGDFLSPTVNRDYDRLWLAMKQVSRDSGRALTVSELEPEGIPPLPAKLLRALKVLAFDLQGRPITSNLTLEQLEQQPALAIEAVAQAQAAADGAVTSAAAAHDFADAAGGSAIAAGDSAVLAQKWAENPEDTPVQPGLFSAKHWAAKAAASLSGLLARVLNLETKGSLGVGQIYRNLTATRALGTVYAADTNRTIWIHVNYQVAVSVARASLTIVQGGVTTVIEGTTIGGSGLVTSISAPIPPGATTTYRVDNVGGGSPSVLNWVELRT